MTTIYKYPFTEKGKENNLIQMPKGAEILHIAEQHGDIQIWAKVDTENALQSRRFELFGTGHEIPRDGKDRLFVGTFLMHGGAYVFHLFEVLQ